MKKIFALAALCCAMGANAEVFTYDFNTSPSFFPYLQAPIDDPEAPGMGQTGNYDFIDKTGTAKVPGSDGELLQYAEEITNEDGTVTKIWHCTENKVRISLGDGCAYYKNAAGKWMNEEDELDLDEPFITYGDKGPSRVIWMAGWGSLDAWADANYNAVNEENWVSTKHGFAFNRNANSGSREDTYIQFPEVEGPASLNIWAGHAGGKYVTELRVKIIPVVNGEEREAFCYYLPLDQTVDKRYFKLTPKNLDTVTTKTLSDGSNVRAWGDLYTGKDKVAYKIGCHKSEMSLYHIEINTGADAFAGLEALEAAQNEDSRAFNLLGQPVGDDYKGLVIRNGKKFLRK